MRLEFEVLEMTLGREHFTILQIFYKGENEMFDSIIIFLKHLVLVIFTLKLSCLHSYTLTRISV